MSKFNIGDHVYGIIFFSPIDLDRYNSLNFRSINGTIKHINSDEFNNFSYYIEDEHDQSCRETIYEHLVFSNIEDMFKYVFKTEKNLLNEYLKKLNEEENKFKENMQKYISNYWNEASYKNLTSNR